VVPQWSLATIYRGMSDYMVIQVIVLILLLLFPQIALWLPSAVRQDRSSVVLSTRAAAARRQRPHGRAAEKGDELTPPHVLPSAEDHTLPHR
jgi:hypothetical protein